MKKKKKKKITQTLKNTKQLRKTHKFREKATWNIETIPWIFCLKSLSCLSKIDKEREND